MVKRLLLMLVVGAALAGGVYVFAFGWPSALDPVRSWVAAMLPGSTSTATQAPPAPAPPPPEVGVVVVRPTEVPFPVEYAGRVEGFRDVEVRPQVSGLLLKREYVEGAKVKQDQVLFRIDPATYEVALHRAEAQLQQAQATLRLAEENFGRTDQLVRRGVSTEKQLDQDLAARDQARASLQLAQAEIEGARLNLSYTVVHAPIAGVTALQSPPVGTLIQAQQTLLTTITQLDPAYVSFSFTDEEGQAFRELNHRRKKPITEEDLVVDLQYATRSVYSQPGKIDTRAQRVDPQTGTIQARAIFPNPEGVLLPGQFVRVRVRGITLPDAIVIPKQAVSQGPQGPSVYVVGENDIAQARPIRLGPEIASGWVVQEGLKGGERVVADGVIRIRPGAPVRPVPVSPGPQATQTSGSAGGQPAGTRP